MLMQAAQAGLRGRSVRLSQQAVGRQQLGLLTAASTPEGQGSLSNTLVSEEHDCAPWLESPGGCAGVYANSVSFCCMQISATSLLLRPCIKLTAIELLSRLH